MDMYIANILTKANKETLKRNNVNIYSGIDKVLSLLLKVEFWIFSAGQNNFHCSSTLNDNPEQN
jgi:hypothetical protein